MQTLTFTPRDRKMLALACKNAERAAAREVPVRHALTDEPEKRYLERGAEIMRTLNELIRQNDGEYPYVCRWRKVEGVARKGMRLRVIERKCKDLEDSYQVEFEDGSRAVMHRSGMVRCS